MAMITVSSSVYPQEKRGSCQICSSGLFSTGPRKRHCESQLPQKNSSRYLGFFETHVCNSSRTAKVRVTDFCQVLSLLFPLFITQWNSTAPPTLPGNSNVNKNKNDRDMIQPQFLTSSQCLPERLSAYQCGVSISFRFQVLRIYNIGGSVFASSTIAFFLWYTSVYNFSGSGLCFLMTCTKNVTQE